jgi:hypothetical protein
MPFLHKYLGNPVLSFIGRLFFKSDIGDFHCGLRGFRSDIVQILGLQTTGMEFASEMVVKATLFDLKIAEVPTILSPDGRTRPPHLRTWRDGWRHLRFLLVFSPRWLYLIPGVALMLFGLVVGGLVVHGPKHALGVTFDTNTLIYAGTAVVIGFQAIMFGLFTRVYGMQTGFLPRKEALKRFTEKATLEKSLIAGLLVFLVGVGTAIYAIVVWSDAGYGYLVYPKILRIVIPSAVAIIVGFQIMLAAFFMSVLSINRK